MYNAKIAKAASFAQAERLIRSIGVSEQCVLLMRTKAIFRLIRLKKVRCAVANIIKQEMLSCGADATVSQWSVDCSRPYTDVLLMGTIKQYQKLIAKMRAQAAHLPPSKKREYLAVSEEISEALRKDLGRI